jgi:hypothetical protein
LRFPDAIGVLRRENVHFVKFIVAELMPQVDSDEAPIGTRETREITASELAALLRAMLRGN